MNRLYGTSNAETLYDDPATVWESEIEPCLDDLVPDCWIIEEWTVVPPIDHIPRAEYIAEYIAEKAADDQGADVSADVFDEAMKQPDVQRALARLRRRIAKHVTFYQAGEKVTDHVLTLVDGEPFLDGEPLYRPAPGAE